MGIKLHRPELSRVFHNQGSDEHRYWFQQKSCNTHTKIFKPNSKSLSKYERKYPEIGNTGVISLCYQLPLRFLVCITFSKAEIWKLFRGFPDDRKAAADNQADWTVSFCTTATILVCVASSSEQISLRNSNTNQTSNCVDDTAIYNDQWSAVRQITSQIPENLSSTYNIQVGFTLS